MAFDTDNLKVVGVGEGVSTERTPIHARRFTDLADAIHSPGYSDPDTIMALADAMDIELRITEGPCSVRLMANRACRLAGKEL